MTTSQNGPATSPAGPSGHHCTWCHKDTHSTYDCPDLNERDPLGRGLILLDLLNDLAVFRSQAAVTYAEAFLDHQGTDAQRTQAAKNAAAGDHLDAELAAARVAAYRHIIGIDGGPNHATS